MGKRLKGPPLLAEYGEMWPRNNANIKLIPKGQRGVYVFYDGLMPVYVGKGKVLSRVRGHTRSKRFRQLWDHFTWYVVPDLEYCHDLEVLMLRRLPWYLQGLNRQGGHLRSGTRIEPVNGAPDAITRKKS
jgi:hypothetical protein